MDDWRGDKIVMSVFADFLGGGLRGRSRMRIGIFIPSLGRR